MRPPCAACLPCPESCVSSCRSSMQAKHARLLMNALLHHCFSASYNVQLFCVHGAACARNKECDASSPHKALGCTAFAGATAIHRDKKHILPTDGQHSPKHAVVTTLETQYDSSTDAALRCQSLHTCGRRGGRKARGAAATFAASAWTSCSRCASTAHGIHLHIATIS